MACELVTGVGLDGCRNGIGGIKRVFIGKLSDFQTGVTIDPTTEEVTALPEATIFQFDFQKNTGEHTCVPKIGADNSGVTFETTIKFQFAKLSAAKRLLLESLTRLRLVIFVQTSSNQILMCGLSEGCDFSNGNFSAGKAKADFEGYKLEFMATEMHADYHLEAFTSAPFDNFGDIIVSSTQIND